MQAPSNKKLAAMGFAEALETENDLEYETFWQTQRRGTNHNEYQIYVRCATDLGWKVKSFDEWLGV
jgi:hypothetical protein